MNNEFLPIMLQFRSTWSGFTQFWYVLKGLPLPKRHYADIGHRIELCRQLWFSRNHFNARLSQKQIYQHYSLDLPDLLRPFKYLISQ